jgi:hypothetical protein
MTFPFLISNSLAQTCFIRIVYNGCNSSGVPHWCHLIEAVAPGRAAFPIPNSKASLSELSAKLDRLYPEPRTSEP